MSGRDALSEALGLEAGESAAAGALLAEALDGLGLEGSRVVARLSAGEPLGAALGLPAGTVDLLYARAHAWLQTARYDRAEPLFRALCLMAGDVADHWVGYGLCLKERGDAVDAAAAFTAAIRLRPDWPIAHFHAFDLAARTGDWATADHHRARFDALATDAVPQAVRDAAERLKLAVDLHRDRAGRRP